MASFFFPSIASFNRLMGGQYVVEDAQWCMGRALSSCAWHPYANGVVDAEDTFSKVEGGKKMPASYADAMQAYFEKFAPQQNSLEALFKAGAEAVYWTKRSDRCAELTVLSIARLRSLFDHQKQRVLDVCGLTPPEKEITQEQWAAMVEAHILTIENARWSSIEAMTALEGTLTHEGAPDIAAVKARFAAAAASRDTLFRNQDGSLQIGGGQEEDIQEIQRVLQSLRLGNRPAGVAAQEDDAIYLGARPTREMVDYVNLSKLHLADLELEWTRDWKKATEWLATLDAGRLPLKPMHVLFQSLSNALAKDISIADMRRHLTLAAAAFEKLFQLATATKTPLEARSILLSLLEKSKDVFAYALALYNAHPAHTPNSKKNDPLLRQRKKMLTPRCLPYQNIGTQSVSMCSA